MLKHPLLALAAATLLSAPAAAYAQSAASPTPTAGQPTRAADYVTAAGASDQFEIQSSQIAVAQAQRSEVKDFARMMVEHHTRTTADLTAAAREAGLSPPAPALSPDKTSKVAALRRATGADFDRQYMSEQVAAHQEALALHETYAAQGDQPALKAAAGKTAPIVRSHLTRAQALAASR